jgi:Multiubiquitin
MNATSQTYEFSIDDNNQASEDPIITGQQLLDLAGKHPTDQRLAYQLLQNGQLEGIRPDEAVDLRKPGIEKFLTFDADRAFYFTLDGQKFEWPASAITGRKLKDLAKVDHATYEVWQEIRGAEDLAIDDTELVSLEPQGTERFFTGKKNTTEG